MVVMKPDREVRDGLHTDYFWPGRVLSIWRFGFFELKRERQFKARTTIAGRPWNYDQSQIAKVAWQWSLRIKHVTVGGRVEVDKR